MPRGIAKNGHRNPPQPAVQLTPEQRAEARTIWRQNLTVLGIDPDNRGEWTRYKLRDALRDEGMPTITTLAHRYGVSNCTMSYIIRDLPTTHSRRGPRNPATFRLPSLNQRFALCYLALQPTPVPFYETAKTIAHAQRITVSGGWRLLTDLAAYGAVSIAPGTDPNGGRRKINYVAITNVGRHAIGGTTEAVV